MKKIPLLVSLITIILLTACQNVAPGDTPRQSAEELEQDKAQAVSKINIVVGESQTGSTTTNQNIQP